MKTVLLVVVGAVASLTSGAIAGDSAGLGLDETLLGVPNPPFRVGDVVSDEQLSTLQCTESGNGALVCPVRRYDDRMFGVVIDRAESPHRVKAAFVSWVCDTDRCAQEFEQTVTLYENKLGKKRELLNGTPIWKDREASSRDLMVTRMGDKMISVVLLRSDP